MGENIIPSASLAHLSSVFSFLPPFISISFFLFFALWDLLERATQESALDLAYYVLARFTADIETAFVRV